MEKPRFTLRGLLFLIFIVAAFFGLWRVMDRQRPITKQESAEIKLGMSKSQVNWRLGGPRRVYATKGQESWVFEYADTEKLPEKYFTVTFQRGEIVEIEKSASQISEGVRKAFIERGPP